MSMRGSKSKGKAPMTVNLSAPAGIWAGAIMGYLSAEMFGTLTGAVVGLAVFVATFAAVEHRLYGDGQ